MSAGMKCKDLGSHLLPWNFVFKCSLSPAFLMPLAQGPAAFHISYSAVKKAKPVTFLISLCSQWDGILFHSIDLTPHIFPSTVECLFHLLTSLSITFVTHSFIQISDLELLQDDYWTELCACSIRNTRISTCEPSIKEKLFLNHVGIVFKNLLI